MLCQLAPSLFGMHAVSGFTQPLAAQFDADGHIDMERDARVLGVSLRGMRGELLIYAPGHAGSPSLNGVRTSAIKRSSTSVVRNMLAHAEQLTENDCCSRQRVFVGRVGEAEFKRLSADACSRFARVTQVNHGTVPGGYLVGGVIARTNPTTLASNCRAVARLQLAEFVDTHVQRRAVLGSISLQGGLVCTCCRETVPERQVELRLARGFTSLQCPICETVNDLSAGPNESAPATRARISEMDRNADRAHDGDTGQTTVHGKRRLDEFDVFLCHNAKDKPGVRALADGLEAHGILPWLDERAVTAGTDWIKALQKQIRKIRCACVCVGSSGVGPWQDVELKALLNEFSRRRCRLIPVNLSSATKKPRLPPLLQRSTWVDFRQLEPDPMQRLVEALRTPHLA